MLEGLKDLKESIDKILDYFDYIASAPGKIKAFWLEFWRYDGGIYRLCTIGLIIGCLVIMVDHKIGIKIIKFSIIIYFFAALIYGVFLPS